jgi:hypothetical protein
LIVQRVCFGISDMCILYFNQINPPYYLLFLSPCSPIMQQPTVYYLYYNNVLMGYFSSFHSLTFSFVRTLDPWGYSDFYVGLFFVHVWCWKLNAGLHACYASSLPTSYSCCASLGGICAHRCYLKRLLDRLLTSHS